MPDRPQIFFDTIVLSNFARAGRLDILSDRYRGRMFVSQQVLDELIAGEMAGHRHVAQVLELVSKSVLRVVPVSGAELGEYRILLQTLGEGEASVIALAKSRKAVVASDDQAARNACVRLKILVTGTLGILAACVRDGQISERDADDCLQRIIAGGFYSPVERIGEIL